MVDMKLNSINDNIFTVEDVKKSGMTFSDEKVEQMIADYRLLAVEAAGRGISNARKGVGMSKYNNRLEDTEYRKMMADTHKRFQECLVDVYCKDLGLQNNGQQLTEEMLKNRKVMAVASKWLSVIVTPSYPAVLSDAFDMFVDVVTAEKGKAAQIDIMSTEIIRFDDSADGSTLTAGLQQIHNGSISVLPEPKTAVCELPMRYLITNPNMIAQIYTAIFKGMQAYIMGRFGKALKLLHTNTATNGATFVFDGVENDLSAVEAVATLNGIPVTQVARIGTMQKLNKVLPSGTSVDSGLSMLLGREWFENGFVGVVNGAPSIAITNAFVPGTQYSQGAQYVIDTDELYYIPMIGDAIMYLAIEDGSPMEIELTPSQTKDGTYLMNVTTRLGLEIALGRQCAVIYS